MESAESYILFELAGTAYAVSSAVIRRMEMVDRVTPVPNAPAFVDGVVFSRGAVVPVLNLRTRFGIARAEYDMKTRLIVVAHGERVVGLLVDSAREFITIPAASIQPPPDSLAGTTGNSLTGIAVVADRVVLVLDVGKILNHAADPAPRPPA